MSQQNISLLALSVVAAGVLAAHRCIDGDGAYTAAGAPALGVTRSSAAAAGELVPVDVIGTAVVEAEAAITADLFLQVGTDGKVIPHTTGVPVARAAPGATAAADGDLLEVILLLAIPHSPDT